MDDFVQQAGRWWDAATEEERSAAVRVLERWSRAIGEQQVNLEPGASRELYRMFSLTLSQVREEMGPAPTAEVARLAEVWGRLEPRQQSASIMGLHDRLGLDDTGRCLVQEVALSLSPPPFHDQTTYQQVQLLAGIAREVDATVRLYPAYYGRETEAYLSVSGAIGRLVSPWNGERPLEPCVHWSHVGPEHRTQLFREIADLARPASRSEIIHPEAQEHFRALWQGLDQILSPVRQVPRSRD